MFNKEELSYPEMIVTMGPSLEDEDTLEKVLSAGARFFRFNMSHSDQETHAKTLELLKKVSKKLDAPVTTFADLSGPKIRIREVKEGVILVKGDEIFLTSRPLIGDAHEISITYDNLAKEVVPKNHILIDDGKIIVEVIEAIATEVRCKVVQGGPLFSHKGINIPEASLSVSPLTEKDKKDALFAVGLGFDALALSFIRSAHDVQELRSFLHSHGFTHLPIIVKLETRFAMLHMKEIIHESDMVMVARGDLGIEVDVTTLPFYQKEICKVARQARKPVIVATQILTSMLEHPYPTRAEVSDGANAVLDGASYLMLSDETTVGKYPVQAVQTLASIIKTAHEARPIL